MTSSYPIPTGLTETDEVIKKSRFITLINHTNGRQAAREFIDTFVNSTRMPDITAGPLSPQHQTKPLNGASVMMASLQVPQENLSWQGCRVQGLVSYVRLWCAIPAV